MKRLCFVQAALFALLALFALFPAEAQLRQNGALGFRDAARLAVANSNELRAGRAGRALREGAWKAGLRAYLPQLSLAVSEDDRLSQIGADSFLKNYTVSLDQLVWDGGRTGTARSLERAELVLLGDQLERNEAEIAEAAFDAYRGVLIGRRIILIRESALESLAEQRRILEEEFALGMVTALDVAEGNITYREAELELAALRLEAEETETLFAELLGLDEVPELAESIDIFRKASPPSPDAARQTALARNPDLVLARHTLERRRIEAKSASLSWLPSLRASAGFTLSGQRYPLTRHSWSLGLTLNFSSPWFSGALGGSAGWEPPYDKSARVQSSVSPLPDPASGIGAKQAKLALVRERENYSALLSKTGRAAVLGTEKINLSERRRIMALEALDLAAEKYRLTETLMGLGRITRVELMEARIEYAEKETEAVNAAAALLAAERDMERLLKLRPGTLANSLGRIGGIQ
ncbi:MAG: TolC family protein [Treponema sp.]|jgi:outer membrane protein TolC|nr:TolC family protein [Treponema sp.]